MRPTTIVLVVDDEREVVLGRVDDRHPDLALVHALARLQLTARRLGGSIRVRDATAELDRLLTLAGLDALSEPSRCDHDRRDERPPSPAT